MKITRNQLRRLIEGMIGYPDRPPVNPEKYIKGDEINPKISRAIQSTDDPDYRRQFINLGATLGDEVLDVLDNIPVSQVDSFIDDDNEPLDKSVAFFQSFAHQMDASPWRGKQINSYLTAWMAGEEFEVAINGDILTDIYEAIADGNNSGAKNIAHDYLNTGFLNSNPEVANWYNKNFRGSSFASFADFYFNQKIDDIHIFGILPYEFDLSMWNRMAIGKILRFYDLRRNREGEGKKRLEIKVENDMREDVYRLAKSLGLLSQGFGSHPVAYHFYDPRIGSIDIG
jgi:hypothetical protein